jgi:hypothetical protein
MQVPADVVFRLDGIAGGAASQTARSLIAVVTGGQQTLSGTSASLFSSLRVEEVSGWLPVLQAEKECHGPALTVGEFSRVLDDLRKQILVARSGQTDRRVRSFMSTLRFRILHIVSEKAKRFSVRPCAHKSALPRVPNRWT